MKIMKVKKILDAWEVLKLEANNILILKHPIILWSFLHYCLK